jgi:oligoendopeptidase F
MMDWRWEQIDPFYRELAARPLSAASVNEFMQDWTRLNERLDEIANRLYVATTVNTADEAASRRFHRYLDEVFPPMQAAEQVLKGKLLASGLEPENFALARRKMQAEADLFRPVNLPLLAQDQKLGTEHERIVGAQTVNWQGSELTVARLRTELANPDQSVREQAWRAIAGRQLADRAAINELWQRMLKVRVEIARNAGCADFRELRWRQMLRFDYTPENCVQFQNAIEETVAPAARRVYERKRAKLGLKALRPWDTDVDPLGRPPLKPFQTTAELQARSRTIFEQVDPAFRDYLDTMIREDLLDLANRKNKAPGAYCTTYQASRRPFLFLNAVGTESDVRTMIHEAGHAFHAFEALRLPFYQQRQYGLEFAEVASMGMELLALPYIGQATGGFYSEPDRRRAIRDQLERNLLFWPYMAVVDSFQHWVYENPGPALAPDRCDAAWTERWHRFMTGVDWTGLDQELMTGWQRKPHIHTTPFYYVEYGLAQLGATQLWANALQDQAGAVRSYRAALGLGGTRSLPELYAAAGVKFAFDAATLGPAVELIERKLTEVDE